MLYEQIKYKEKEFLSLTSLHVEEFEELLIHFSPVCEKYFRYHTLDGQKRKFPVHTERDNIKFQGSAQKLLFLLVFLKTNALQEHHAISFGISQTRVSRLSKVLLPLLNETLRKMGLQPIRDGELLEKTLAEHPSKNFSYDGLERGIQRNQCPEAQEVEFSGKKKAHKIKNNVLCDEIQFIHYLSPTECGSVHDKTIADEYPIHLPQGSTLKQDLGFQKHQPEGINIEIPYKKPKNQELTFSQKIYNKIFSGTRIAIEHANTGIKRLRIIKDIIRIHDAEFRDLVLVVACGLHNFRLLSQHPKRKYYQSRA